MGSNPTLSVRHQWQRQRRGGNRSETGGADRAEPHCQTTTLRPCVSQVNKKQRTGSMTATNRLITALGACAGLLWVTPVPQHQTSTTCIVPVDGLLPNHPFRELSGLAWDPVLQLAVGVRDERLDHPGYEIFAFDPNTVGPDGCHTALPLLGETLSAEFQLDDLESLARADDGVYYAMGSLSLDRVPSPDRDRWTRFQGVRFTLAIQQGRPSVDTIEQLSADNRPDLREWMISSSGRDWTHGAYRRRAEDGGINVEGLAWRSDGTLLLGFRGPLDSGPAAPVLSLDPPETGQPPRTLAWTSIDVSGLPASNKEEQQRGVRGIVRIPQTSPEQYVVVVGHTGGRHDRLRLLLWEPVSGTTQDRGALPEGFVGEGIAILDAASGVLNALLVDDRRGRALRLAIDAWR